LCLLPLQIHARINSCKFHMKIGPRNNTILLSWTVDVDFFKSMHTVLKATPKPEIFISNLISQVWKSLIQLLTSLRLMEKHGKPSNKTVCVYTDLNIQNQQNHTRIGPKL
jgi:hypothetical protein